MKKYVTVVSTVALIVAVLWGVYRKDLASLSTYQNPETTDSHTCTISGHIDGYGWNSIGLTYSDSGRSRYIHIDQHNGDFMVKLHVSEPGLAFISYNQYNWLPKYGKHSSGDLVVEPGAMIYVEGTADSLRYLRVKGSPIYTQLDSLNKAVMAQMDHDAITYMDKARAEHADEFDAIKTVKDTVLRKKKYQEFGDKYYRNVSSEKYYFDFIKTHPGAVVSALELSQLNHYLSPEENLTLYNCLDSSLRQLSYAKAFERRMLALKNTQPGMEAPDVALPDADGRSVSLSSLRGKITLLEFWWPNSGSCTGQKPSEMLEAYAQYHAKGFEVYAVCGGRNKKNWLDAIEKDKLTWINVMDTSKYPSYICAKVYGSRGTPSNILIDKDGRILARDLGGNQLKSQLAELLR